MKFAKDRKRWLQWLFEAKRRYGLTVLNFTVTSNHIHLLVHDTAGKEVIPKSIQLVAGRTGQEYNRRKKRKGAFWEDRYHATIIEDGDHLLRCIVYIDINMVRNGVVDHPERWPYGGYNEIQQPRRKCQIIDYEALWQLSGFQDFSSFQAAHRKWVLAETRNTDRCREPQWTEAIAVGSESFVQSVKKQLGFKAIGRRVRSSQDIFELREDQFPYKCIFEGEKCDIAPEYTPALNEKRIISG